MLHGTPTILVLQLSGHVVLQGICIGDSGLLRRLTLLGLLVELKLNAPSTDEICFNRISHC